MVANKGRYIPLSSAAAQSLVNGGSEYKILLLFPVRLYSFSPPDQTLGARTSSVEEE